jgi:hypothetical protein
MWDEAVQFLLIGDRASTVPTRTPTARCSTGSPRPAWS